MLPCMAATKWSSSPPKNSARLKGDLTGEALIAAMQAPNRDIEIEPKRAPMPVRKVVL